MNCTYFGKCASCTLYPDYQQQLTLKVEQFHQLFKKEFDIFPSKEEHYRARAEFRIKDNSYAMHTFSKELLPISSCSMVIEPIYQLMPKLLEFLSKDKLLFNKLFRVDFLSSLNGQTLVSLIYHKKLTSNWKEKAKELKERLKIDLIGRSKGVKIVVEKEFIEERLNVLGREFRYLQYETSFTQPNPYVNQKMLEWAVKESRNFGGDLLELYCGIGNFTLPLSFNFEKVLATEASKTSIKTAKENARLNYISNVTFVRLLSNEVAQALKGEREFRRLREVDLDSFNFTTVFVDPPRAGLDEESKEFIKRFKNIIYISCNPLTLHRDLQELTKTHSILKLAVFDQFPYTPHLEAGVILTQ